MIDRCSVTAVYLSDKTASSKWVNREIEESIKRGKGVIGVYKGDKAPTSVPPAFQQNGCKSVKREHAALMKAIAASLIEMALPDTSRSSKQRYRLMAIGRQWLEAYPYGSSP